jgi:hypothetical protein
MDLSSSPGVGVKLAALLVVLGAFVAPVASAQNVHVLIITGLAGEPQYGTVFRAEAGLLADSARRRWGVADSSLVVLGEDPAEDPKHITGHSTKEEITKAFLQLSKRVVPGDVVLVFLNGHGTGEGASSKVNVPGPDPTAGEYAAWLSGFAAQTVVFVNAASGSGDFGAVLAGKNRLVVTATKTAIERNASVFAMPFVNGLVGAADTDKDDRVSVLEAFEFAKKEVARLYEADKRLLTEHATLSDTALARSVSFGAPRAAADPRVVAMIAERQQLEAQVAALRARKATTDSTIYANELENLILKIAEKSQAIRAAGGKP